MDALDFVLITGDLFDTADQWEFDQFQQVIRNLEKPDFDFDGGLPILQSLDKHDRHQGFRCPGYHFPYG